MANTRSAMVPRIRFETIEPTPVEVLPRMDVAVFVGFAASGPLHVPVVLEDANQFRLIFGDAPALAWDAAQGEWLHAHLAPTVRGFFANGGRRCWVIRVASIKATYNYFPVPYLLKADVGTSNPVATLAPVFARARAEGSWSDGGKLSVALRVRSFAVQSFEPTVAVLNVSLGLGAGEGEGLSSVAGTLVRLQFQMKDQSVWWLYAQPVAMDAIDSAPSLMRYHLNQVFWFADSPADTLGSDALAVTININVLSDHPRTQDIFDSNDPYAEPIYDQTTFALQATLYLLSQGNAVLQVDIPQAGDENIDVGTVIHLTVGTQSAWFVVRANRLTLRDGSPGNVQWFKQLEGEVYWPRTPSNSSFDEHAPPRGEILTLDMRGEMNATMQAPLRGIGLCRRHARYWGALCGDQGRYRPRPGTTHYSLVDEAREIAFPYASVDATRNETEQIYLPLGMPSVWSAPMRAIHQSAYPLERDGLAEYSAALFLDTALATSGIRTLLSTADDIRLFAPRPRPLCGLHAALGFGESRIADEITLMAIPDAVHPFWSKRDVGAVQIVSVDNAPLPSPPDANFTDCSVPFIDAPILQASVNPGATGYVVLTWNAVTDTYYVLEESETPEFEHTIEIYGGTAAEIELNRPTGGRYCFRVRATRRDNTSAWSNCLIVTLPSQVAYEVEDTRYYSALNLLAVHKALLRLSAARGDWFGVLSLPRHFRARETRAYVVQLNASLALESKPSPLSFGALYHPWLYCRDDELGIVATPADGVVVGVVAARANARGAWVAPANQRFKTALELVATIEEMADIPVNTLLTTPEGIMNWRADTLDGSDADLRLINVRRLLILLRRLALRHGANYAFEPNGPQLQRLVQRRFDQLLRLLYDRGAFAGAKPELAFQVDTGAEFNSLRTQDSGQLIVALRVRPALPMEFITVRLMQRGDQLQIAEGR